MELGILSIQDLYEFGFDKFLKLSKIYLKYLGMKDIEIAQIDYKSVDYLCSYNNEMIYVQCMLEDLTEIENADKEIYSVGRPDVQKLLGQMVHDGVRCGIVITNESINFTDKLDGDL